MTTVQQLQEAGFNDSEINDYVSVERKKMFDAGFNDKKINDYFGVVPDDSDLYQAVDEYNQRMDDLSENLITQHFAEKTEVPEGYAGNLEMMRYNKTREQYSKFGTPMELKAVKEKPLWDKEKNVFQNIIGLGEESIEKQKNLINALHNMVIYPHDYELDISMKGIKSVPKQGKDITEVDLPFWWIAKSGWETSTIGLGLKAPSPESERIFRLLEDRKNRLPFTERLIQGPGQILGDVPSYLIGALIGGGVSGGNPIGIGAGAMGFTQALRKKLMFQYEKGEVVDLKDLSDRTVKIIWEGTKGAAVGGVIGGVGKFVGPGIGRFLAEDTAMTVTASILEGELPKLDDFVTNGILIKGAHGLGFVKSKLFKIYAETGIKPSEVYADVQQNPSIGAELLKPTEEIPKIYQEYKAKTESHIGEAILNADKPPEIQKTEAAPESSTTRPNLTPEAQVLFDKVLEESNGNFIEASRKMREQSGSEIGNEVLMNNYGGANVPDLMYSKLEHIQEFANNLTPEDISNLKNAKGMLYNKYQKLSSEGHLDANKYGQQAVYLQELIQQKLEVDATKLGLIDYVKRQRDKARAKGIPTRESLQEQGFVRGSQEGLSQEGPQSNPDVARRNQFVGEAESAIEPYSFTEKGYTVTQVKEHPSDKFTEERIIQSEKPVIDEQGFDWTSGIQATDAEKGLASDFRSQEAQRGSISLKETDTSKFKFEDPNMEKDTERMMEGMQPDPQLQKVKDAFISFGHKLTRTFEHLPRTGFFAEAHMILLNFKKYRNIAFEIATNKISHITSRLDPQAFNLFARKIILEDFIESGERGETLPASFTLEKCKAELNRVNTEIGKSEFVQQIKESLDARKILYDEIVSNKIAAMKDLGIDISDIYNRKNYFRHQVMEYIRAKGVFGSGTRLRKRVRSSYEQKRQGYEGDINLNYIQTEHEVVSQMIFDTERAKFYKRLDDSYNIIKKVKADAKSKKLEDWREAIPDRYVEHKIDSSSNFYFVDTIPAKLAEELASGVLEEIGIKPEDVRKALAIGSKKQSMVIPEELALTLTDLNKTRLPHPFLDGLRKVQSAWKWQLAGGNPFKILRWNTRNFVGDATFDWIGNLGTFSKLGKSLGDLWNCFGNAKKLEGDLADFHKRGAFDTTQQINEMHELNDMKVFMHLKHPNMPLKDIPIETLRFWFRSVKISNQFREAILRYAGYLDYKEQMENDPGGLGRPKNFGASIPKEIMALKDIKDRAFMLSNQLHGAYDMVGVIGSAIGDYAQVFYRYKETNFRRYYRLFANAVTNSDNLCQQVGESVLARTTKLSAKAFTRSGTIMAGRMVLRAVSFWALSSIWNHTRYPDEENELPEDVRKQHHIIFGRNDDGTIRYFNRLDPLGDFFSILGLDGGITRLQRWMRGQDSLMDLAKETARKATNQVISGMEPISKTMYELLTRQSLFPNAFKPKLIRNKVQYLMRQIGLESEYNALFKITTGRPIGEPYIQRKTKDIFFYSIDPYSASYNDIISKQYQFMQKKGLSDGGFYISPMGNALYYARQALRMGDKEGVQKWMAEYMKYGGKFENLYNSIERLMPLEGVPNQYRAEFISTLDKEDKTKLLKAFKYYEELVTGKDISKEEMNKNQEGK